MVYIGHMLQVQLHRSAFLQISTGSVSQWELLSIVVVAVLNTVNAVRQGSINVLFSSTQSDCAHRRNLKSLYVEFVWLLHLWNSSNAMSFCLRWRGTIPVRISGICVAFKPFMSLLQAQLWPEFLSTTMSLLPLGVARITNFPILHINAFKFKVFYPFAYGTTYVQRTVEKVVLVILLLDSVMSALVHGWRRMYSWCICNKTGADFSIPGGLYFESGTRPKLRPCEKIYPTV